MAFRLAPFGYDCSLAGKGSGFYGSVQSSFWFIFAGGGSWYGGYSCYRGYRFYRFLLAGGDACAPGQALLIQAVCSKLSVPMSRGASSFFLFGAAPEHGINFRAHLLESTLSLLILCFFSAHSLLFSSCRFRVVFESFSRLTAEGSLFEMSSTSQHIHIQKAQTSVAYSLTEAFALPLHLNKQQEAYADMAI